LRLVRTPGRHHAGVEALEQHERKAASGFGGGLLALGRSFALARRWFPFLARVLVVVEGSQAGEWFPEVMAGDTVVLDVETGEERLVQESALVVAATKVQGMRVGEQREAGFDEPGIVDKVVVGDTEALGQAFTFALDLAQLLPDLGLRDGAVGSQVDQVGLLGVKPAQLVGQLTLEQPSRGVGVVECRGDVVAYVGDELFVETQRGVVILDRALDE